MHLNMKTTAALFCLIHLATAESFAQTDTLFAASTLPVQVSDASTVSISFPCAVKSLDRGSAELLAQRVKEQDNIVLLKAARKDISPTSLIVITEDGKLHAFEAIYQQRPSATALSLLDRQKTAATMDAYKPVDKAQIRHQITLAETAAANLHITEKAGGFSAAIEGFYVAGPFMFVRLSLENRSVIGYDALPLSIFTEDQKRLKRSASQKDQIPLQAGSELPAQIKPSEQKTFVLAFAKLTIAESKRISIHIAERGGARNLTLHLKAKHFRNIRTL